MRRREEKSQLLKSEFKTSISQTFFDGKDLGRFSTTEQRGKSGSTDSSQSNLNEQGVAAAQPIVSQENNFGKIGKNVELETKSQEASHPGISTDLTHRGILNEHQLTAT